MRALSAVCSALPDSVFCRHASNALPSFLRHDAWTDLMWSDPDDIDNWAVSPRGAGWLFGGERHTRGTSASTNHCSPILLNLTPSPYPALLPTHATQPQVQSHKLPKSNCPRTPTRPRGFQIHVRRGTRHSMECAKLLLPVRPPSPCHGWRHDGD